MREETGSTLSAIINRLILEKPVGQSERLEDKLTAGEAARNLQVWSDRDRPAEALSIQRHEGRKM